jgi:hypothetical protein
MLPGADKLPRKYNVPDQQGVLPDWYYSNIHKWRAFAKNYLYAYLWPFYETKPVAFSGGSSKDAASRAQ